MAQEEKGRGKRVQVTAQTFIEVDDPTKQLPEKAVRVLENEGIKVEVSKLSNRLLADQGRSLIGGNGCISNPGGPSC